MDQKISLMPKATSIGVADFIPVVQDGVNKAITASNFFNSGLPGVFSNLRLTEKESINSNASLSPTGITILLNSTLSPIACILPAGVEGQLKIIVAKELNSNISVTVPEAIGFTSLSFINVGKSATLIFLDNNWYIVSANCIVA